MMIKGELIVNNEVAYFLEQLSGESVEGGWAIRIDEPIYRKVDGRLRVFEDEWDEVGYLVGELIPLTKEEYEWLHYDGISWETPEEFQKDVGRTIHWLVDSEDPVSLATYRKCVFFAVRFGGKFEDYYGHFYDLERLRRNHFGY